MASKLKYERYKSQQRKEKNKVTKLNKYLKTNPNDLKALERLEHVQKLIK